MKNVLSLASLLFFIAANLQLQAQELPKPFPDATGSVPLFVEGQYQDISQHNWDIGAELESGKTVYYFNFDTSDSLSYYYWNSGIMQQFYANHGPNGDNTAAVFATVFAQVYSDINCVNSESYPNTCYWDYTNNTGGVPILPFIEYDNFQQTYNWNCFNSHILWNGFAHTQNEFSVTRICPNRMGSKLIHRFHCKVDTCATYYDVLTLDSLESSLGQCEPATVTHDAAVIYSTADKKAPNFPGQKRALNEVVISNMGTGPLTSANIEVYWNDSLHAVQPWIGYLNTYQIDSFDLDSFVTDGKQGVLTIKTAFPNGINDQNPDNDGISMQIDSAHVMNGDSIKIKMYFVVGGARFGWQLFDDQGVEVQREGCRLLYDIDPYNYYPSLRIQEPSWIGNNVCSQFGNNSPDSLGYPDYELGYPQNEILETNLSIDADQSGYYTLRFLCQTTWGFSYLNTENYMIITEGADTLYDFSQNWWSNDLYYVFRNPDTAIVSSLYEPLNSAALALQPNPADDVVTLTWASKNLKPETWQMLDMLGRTVWTAEEGQAGFVAKLSTAGYSDGLYVVVLQFSDGRRVAKPLLIRH